MGGLPAPNALGRLRLHYPVLGSTNDLARALAVAGYPDGTVVVADEQTAGRGRLGRRWVAPPGTALLCSTLLRPALSAQQAPALTMVAALATRDACASVTGQPVALKWPNDVLIGSGPGGQPRQKVAGLLLETALAGSGFSYAILGIGINVTAHPPDLPGATNLAQAAGQPVARGVLLEALLHRLTTWLDLLVSGPGNTVFDAWRAALVTLGQPVHVTAAKVTLDGVAEAVDASGALLVRTAEGHLHRLLAADVRLGHDRPEPRAAGGARRLWPPGA